EGDECFVPPKVVQIYNSEGVVDRTYRYLYIVWVTNYVEAKLKMLAFRMPTRKQVVGMQNIDLRLVFCKAEKARLDRGIVGSGGPDFKPVEIPAGNLRSRKPNALRRLGGRHNDGIATSTSKFRSKDSFSLLDSHL
ncbi:MAG: hypothetical protein ACXQT4_01680, partial [Methanotrichaceae archaeon]